MKPTALSVEPENIPAELQALRQWVCWRYEWKDEKWTKVPYRTDGESPASTTKAATWGGYPEAVRTYFLGDCGVDGIGFVLSADDGFVGVDLDHCVIDRKVSIWALKIIFELESYTELSPSGTGLRIFLKGKLPPGGRKRGPIEMYDSGRYLTITGHHRAKTPLTIESRQDGIAALHSRVFAPEPKPQPNHYHSKPELELSDSELLERAFRARNGDKVKALYEGDAASYESKSQADLAFCSQLRFYTDDAAQIDRLFRASKLFREKWDERHYGDGRTYGEGTISKVMEGR